MEYYNLDATRNCIKWLVGFVDDNSSMIKLENLGYNNPADKRLRVMLKEGETVERQ